MKKISILLLLVLVLSISVTAFASTSKNDLNMQANMNSGHTSDAKIVPLIEVSIPGNVILSISWANPTLSFTSTTIDTTAYYALKEKADVAFTLVNSSEAGEGGTAPFNGTLDISASTTFKKYLNIDGALKVPSENNGVITLTNATEDDKNKSTEDFSFTYDNGEVTESTDEAELLKDTPSVATAQEKLTAIVQFKITPKSTAVKTPEEP